MTTNWKTTTLRLALLTLLAAMTGCCWWEKPTPTPPLGTLSDPIWSAQQVEGQASAFTIYQHEFELNGTRLNMGGEDHLKSIAARLHKGECIPVVVERSMTSERPDTEYHYPINPNSDLDMKRRDAIVASLVTMGVSNAEQIVVVTSPIPAGYTATEAVRSYNRSLTQQDGSGYGNSGRGGFGGGGFGLAGSSDAP